MLNTLNIIKYTIYILFKYRKNKIFQTDKILNELKGFNYK